jgi:hypothetical protein
MRACLKFCVWWQQCDCSCEYTFLICDVSNFICCHARTWSSTVYALTRLWDPTNHVGFVVNKAELRQVFSEYFGFCCQAFHQLLHTHHGIIFWGNSSYSMEIFRRGVLSIIRQLVLYCKYICVQHKWYDTRTATKLLESLALNIYLKGHFAATWSNLFVTCVFSGSVTASLNPNWHFSINSLF